MRKKEQKHFEEVNSNSIYVFGGARAMYDHHQLGPHAGWVSPVRMIDVNEKNNTLWKMVSKGGSTHLAIDENNKVWGWGLNTHGQVGVDIFPSEVDVVVPTQVSYKDKNGKQIDGVAAQQVSGSYYYTMILDSEGHIWGSGCNYKNCLGKEIPKKNVNLDFNNEYFEAENEYVFNEKYGINYFKLIDDSKRKYKFIAAGTIYGGANRSVAQSWTSFAIDDLGNLYSWGWSKYNINTGSNEKNEVISSPEIIRSPTLKELKWSFIEHNQYFAAAITEDGKLYTWGHNGDNSGGNKRLGTGDGKSGVQPATQVFFSESTKIKKVSLGLMHALALDENGNVWSWGVNNWGILGNGKSPEKHGPSSSTPVKIDNSHFGSERIIDISADYSGSYAVTELGELFVWGSNYAYLLGLADRRPIDGENIYSPVINKFFKNNKIKVNNVVAGYYSAFILAKDHLSPIDNTKKVTELEVISGSHQVIILNSGSLFKPLVVRAIDSTGKPVANAKVNFSIEEVRQNTGTRITTPFPIITDKDGLAMVELMTGTKSGLTKIAAECNEHAVVFNLTILPDWGNLEFIPIPPSYAWDQKEAAKPHILKIRIVTKNNHAEYWPFIPCELSNINIPNGMYAFPDESMLPQTVTSDKDGYINSVLAWFISFSSPSGGTLTCEIKLPIIKGSVKKVSFKISLSH